MIRYALGGRYYHDQEGDELALTEREWRKLQRAERSIRFYDQAGTPIVIRRQRPGEGPEPKE